MVKNLRNQSGFALPIVIFGLLILGLGGIGAYWYLNQQQAGESIQTQTPPKTAFDLVVESPSDQTLVEDKRLVVRGKTSPNATVTIFTEADEVIVQSDSSGMFEGTITLATGINNLVVTAFSETGEEKTVALDVVYDEI